MKHAFWTYGFRPFFLLGSLHVALLIIYWAVSFFTGELPSGHFDPITWHAHEMIYGFVTAIIAGFLLTASANWTASKAVSGYKLITLVVLWLLGRAVFLLPLMNVTISPWVTLFVDISFLPAVVLVLSRPLIKSRQIKNMQFLIVLSIMAIGNVLTHLASFGFIDYSYASKGTYLGINLIIVIMVILGGRVIPFFTQNVVKGEVTRNPLVEKAVHASVWIYVLLDFLTEGASPTAWVALIAGILNIIRMSGWMTFKTKNIPILWVLHLAYLWIGVGFIIVFLSELFSLLPRSVAIHSFTAGAMGILIIGMISRVSLGHTGRPLRLAKGFVIAYWLVSLGAVVRVGSGFIPEWYNHGIFLSGVSWGAGFVVFVIYYYRILVSPRADGK